MNTSTEVTELAPLQDKLAALRILHNREYVTEESKSIEFPLSSVLLILSKLNLSYSFEYSSAFYDLVRWFQPISYTPRNLDVRHLDLFNPNTLNELEYYLNIVKTNIPMPKQYILECYILDVIPKLNEERMI